MSFQFYFEVYPILSMKSSYNKPNHAICTARLSFFHLCQERRAAADTEVASSPTEGWLDLLHFESYYMPVSLQALHQRNVIYSA